MACSSSSCSCGGSCGARQPCSSLPPQRLRAGSGSGSGLATRRDCQHFQSAVRNLAEAPAAGPATPQRASGDGSSDVLDTTSPPNPMPPVEQGGSGNAAATGAALMKGAAIGAFGLLGVGMIYKALND